MSHQLPESLRQLAVPIASLRPYPNNPRQGDIGAIAQSLQAHNQYRPVVVRRQDNTVLAGNHTLAAAQALGWELIAATFVDVPDDADAARIVLVDNRTSDLATNDSTALAALVQELATTPAGLEGTGYDGDALDELLADLGAQQAEVRGDPDAIPEGPEDQEPITKRGDIIRLGRHTLGCIDSADADEVARLLGGVTPHMVWTDPPYGIDLDTDYAALGPAVQGHSYARVLGDDRAFDPRPWLERYALIKEQFWWGADHYHHALPGEGSWLIWDKRTEHSATLFGSHFEACWSRQPHRREIIRHAWAGFAAHDPGERRMHPTQKPVALAEWCFTQYGKEGDGVLDLFGGSGTALIAAERTGRTCYMAELSEHYCDCICERFRALTGIEPVREPAPAEASDHARVPALRRMLDEAGSPSSDEGHDYARESARP